MGKTAGPDWDAVRRDYEEGLGSQVEIAARYGVTTTCLAMRKMRHGWFSGRDAERWEKREAAIDALLDALTQRLKKHARASAKLAEEARALAASQCGPEELAARVDASARAGR